MHSMQFEALCIWQVYFGLGLHALTGVCYSVVLKSCVQLVGLHPAQQLNGKSPAEHATDACCL